MSITKDFARKQVARLAQLYGYPRGEDQASAHNELVEAMQTAEDPKRAEGMVSDLLSESTADSRCPAPGDLRRAFLAKRNAQQAIKKCAHCDGTGWVLLDKLVTYWPGTYNVRKAETLHLDFEGVMAFREKLGKDQAIMGAAKACICLPPTHKYLTGERD